MSDLQLCLMADEVEGFQTASVSSGQDVVADAVAEAVGIFRAALRTAGAALGAAGTLPDELVGAAMDRAALKFLSRVGGAVSETRKTLYRDSEAIRRDVAAGKLICAAPDEADDAAAATLAPSIAARTPTIDRAHQEGL